MTPPSERANDPNERRAQEPPPPPPTDDPVPDDEGGRRDADAETPGPEGDNQAKPDPQVDFRPGPCPIVVVGASAGGFEAATELVQSLPDAPEYAVVLAQHLDPTHESQLAPLLQRQTLVDVLAITDGLSIEPGHIYVVPPDAECVIRDGAFHLVPRRDPHSGRYMIDRLMRSVAESFGPDALGIVLSGTLSDGTEGLGDIKRAGGFTFAQDPESARFAQMPENAIASGNVDYIAKPGEMVEEVRRVLQLSYMERLTTTRPRHSDQERQLGKVFAVLRQGTRMDLSQYKRGTVLRRLHRRMMARRTDDLGAYLQVLENDPEEVTRLRQEMLIDVTRFFRDRASFDTVDETVWPALVKDRAVSDPIRIWVPGCASGEEAYSLAMSVREHLNRLGRNIPVQVFATDVNEQAIRTAREGVYPETIEDDVPHHLLVRYFNKVNGRYQVDRNLRNMCVFAAQDVTLDPPFSNLDMISCRNLLIYMQPELQRRVLAILHYALKPNGFLFLGSSETVTRKEQGFAPVDQKHRIYARTAVHPAPMFRAGQPVTFQSGEGPQPTNPSSERGEAGVRREADKVLLDRFAPASVVVNGQLDVLEFRGKVDPYFTPSPGPASLNLLRLARPGLDMALRSAVEEARDTRRPVQRADLAVAGDDARTRFAIEVIPLGRHKEHDFHALVLFRPAEPAASATSVPGAEPDRASGGSGKTEAEQADEKQLRDELDATRDYLKSMMEDYEATNEELRAANEEALSANEELQSTNEELETAKEELQSTNEELTTLNDELNIRNDQVQRINDDLLNLLNSVDLPIVMVSPDLSIRRFTASAKDVLGLIETDVARPITDLALPFKEDVAGVIRDVVESFERRTTQAHTQDGQTWQVLVHPYRTSDNRVDGAVLVLRPGRMVDVD